MSLGASERIWAGVEGKWHEWKSGGEWRSMALVGIVVRSLVLVPSWMTLAQVGAAMWLRTYVDSRVRFVGGNTADERLPKRSSGAGGWHALRYSEGRAVWRARPSEYLR